MRLECGIDFFIVTMLERCSNDAKRDNILDGELSAHGMLQFVWINVSGWIHKFTKIDVICQEICRNITVVLITDRSPSYCIAIDWRRWYAVFNRCIFSKTSNYAILEMAIVQKLKWSHYHNRKYLKKKSQIRNKFRSLIKAFGCIGRRSLVHWFIRGVGCVGDISGFVKLSKSFNWFKICLQRKTFTCFTLLIIPMKQIIFRSSLNPQIDHTINWNQSKPSEEDICVN